MSNWRTSLPLLVLATVSFAGCQNGIGQHQAIELPKTAQLRTAAEIRQAVGTQGITSWGHQDTGNYWVSYMSPNGTTITKSGSFVDEGVWRLDGDKICLKWHKIRNGAETCLTTYQQGNDIYNVSPDGTVISVATRTVSGNPEHL